jgi:hypothetical protein
LLSCTFHELCYLTYNNILQFTIFIQSWKWVQFPFYFVSGHFKSSRKEKQQTRIPFHESLLAWVIIDMSCFCLSCYCWLVIDVSCYWWVVIAWVVIAESLLGDTMGRDGGSSRRDVPIFNKSTFRPKMPYGMGLSVCLFVTPLLQTAACAINLIIDRETKNKV